jgi:8-oxo-dGTP pyrophosphatase MutT (NUDIX family)
VDVLILLVREGRVLLTERAGDIYLAGRWAIHGGKVDAGGDRVAIIAAIPVHTELAQRLRGRRGGQQLQQAHPALELPPDQPFEGRMHGRLT